MAAQKKYVLDMSQAVINRTAMYTISMDTISGLQDRLVGVQYFGASFLGLIRPEEKPEISGSQLHPLLSNPDEFAKVNWKRTGELKSYPRLFLDPLYVLFDELRETDHVMVLDLSTVTKPEWHSPAVARAYSYAYEKISAVRPRISAISTNTADTLRVNYAFPQERVGVIPLYVPSRRGAFTEKPSAGWVTRPYVLFVGSLEARKNLTGAIKAFELSGLYRDGYDLLIVGGDGHGSDHIRRVAESVSGVYFSGFLSDVELQATYAGASAFIYPSYLEGFGVPLLEAMSHGVPCVASNTGASPEVGSDLVEYYDPDDHDAFAQAINRLVRWTPEQRFSYGYRTNEYISKKYSISEYIKALNANLSS